MTSSTMSRWIRPLNTPIAIWSVNRPDTGEETAAPSATQQIISRQPAFFGSLDTRHAVLFPAQTHTASSPAQASNLTALGELPVSVARELAREHHLLVLRGFDPLPGSAELASYAASWGQVLSWSFGAVLELVEHE